MVPEEYENRSMISDNYNGWADEESCGVFQYPEDFFVSGIEYDYPENKEGKGKEFYGGKNKDKYLVCTWKNGARDKRRESAKYAFAISGTPCLMGQSNHREWGWGAAGA